MIFKVLCKSMKTSNESGINHVGVSTLNDKSEQRRLTQVLLIFGLDDYPPYAGSTRRRKNID